MLGRFFYVSILLWSMHLAISNNNGWNHHCTTRGDHSKRGGNCEAQRERIYIDVSSS
jgi:hypothetical protein